MKDNLPTVIFGFCCCAMYVQHYICVLFVALDTHSYLMSICVFNSCQLLLLTTKCLLMLGHLLILNFSDQPLQICLSSLAKHSFCCLKSDSCLHRVIIVIILCLCFPYFKLAGVCKAGSETKMKQTSSCGAAVIQRYY